MTIRTKLYLSTFIQVLLVVAVGSTLIISSRQISAANDRAAKISSLNEAITQLRFVTFESLLHHDARSLEQWQTKYADITALLAPDPSLPSEQSRLIADALKQQQATKPIFDRLVASYTASVVAQTTLSDFQERLAGQLLVLQQTQVSDIASLFSLNTDDIKARQAQASWIVVIAIVLMLLVTSINSALITRTITASLTRLQEGAKAIASGHLSYRIQASKSRDEFRQLANAFNSMARSLQQIDQLKSNFVMLASHQLRTPATGVKGFINLLLEGYSGPLNKLQIEQLQAANTENEVQLHIIDQIVQVAQTDAGETIIKKADTSLTKLINQVLADQTPAIKARHQTITIHQPESSLTLSIDAGRLAVALANIIDNASKYSPEKAKITISVKADTASVSIAVQDNGYGIAAADQPKLFDQFSRFDNPNSIPAGGSGLSLYLAKKVIDLHHGRLTAMSSLGHGSTFIIHLPR